jgi:hypothetical protein
VSKSVPTRATSSFNPPKCQASIQEAEDNEKCEEEDAASGTVLAVATSAEQPDEGYDEQDDVSQEEQGEEEKQGDDYEKADVSKEAQEEEYQQDENEQEEEEEEAEQDDGEEENSATGIPLAMMSRPAGTSSGDVTKEELESTDSEDSRVDDSDSETETDGRWRLEQIYLNTILNARNEFTLMPSTWRMHFRGIPLPDSLFYFKSKSKSIRPRIYSRTDKLEYRGM